MEERRPTEHEEDSPDPIASIAGRIDLLVAHLASPALLRRFGRDDLAADVIVRLLESKKAKGLGEEELWRFARTVARNTIVDAARKGRHMPRRLTSLAGDGQGLGGSGSSFSILSGQAADDAGPRSIAANREQGRALLDAFVELTPEYRRVIGLRRFEGLSAAETGARMGRSSTAIHSLFRRALEAWSSPGSPPGKPSQAENLNSSDESPGADR